MQNAKSVDDYIKKEKSWPAELKKLREIMLATPLEETIKWGAPCYTYNGKNVVGLVGFKDWFTLWFHQGALLKDEEKVLINAQDGKTKALRQWRMTSAKDIKPSTIKAYVKEAISIVDEGRELKPDRAKRLVVGPELKAAFAKDKKADVAFKSLKPGLKREYADYIKDAKQAATKDRRIAKILPMIKKGVGLNDKYK
ncbi:MAG: hypothetical protein HKN14_06805 [Marinicaulis sp.]|nr:hypothetical protein [Marinicaulis sp.]